MSNTNKPDSTQPTGLTIPEFTTGLVFGFDLGTASIGYAVRKGSEFLDVRAIICAEELGHLKDKRGHRQTRRTLRNKICRKSQKRQRP